MASCNNCAFDLYSCKRCDEFEEYILSITDIAELKTIRRKLLATRIKPDNSISGKIADWLVGKVGTMGCFYAFIFLATLPLIISALMPVIGYISSGYLQLILLPLIMVAGNRSDKIRDDRAARDWKINLITDAIEELSEAKQLAFDQDEHDKMIDFLNKN